MVGKRFPLWKETTQSKARAMSNYIITWNSRFRTRNETHEKKRFPFFKRLRKPGRSKRPSRRTRPVNRGRSPPTELSRITWGKKREVKNKKMFYYFRAAPKWPEPTRDGRFMNDDGQIRSAQRPSEVPNWTGLVERFFRLGLTARRRLDVSSQRKRTACGSSCVHIDRERNAKFRTPSRPFSRLRVPRRRGADRHTRNRLMRHYMDPVRPITGCLKNTPPPPRNSSSSRTRTYD